jgi:hypothetical protein
MNRIPEWNFEEPRCFLCGDEGLKNVRLSINNTQQKAIVCERCRAVYADKGDVYFMGFLSEEQWIRIVVSEDPVITAQPVRVVDPSMN